MKRYYLSPIIGDGSSFDAYRPKLAEYGVSHVALIPSDAAGHPTATWALCLVDAPNHAALIADPALRVLPDFPLDGRLTALSPSGRTAAEAAVTHFGIATDTLDFSNGYRELIRSIGRRLIPSFNENNFDVAG